MATNISPSLKPRDHRVRLLFPFFLNRDSVIETDSVLLGYFHNATKSWPCWEKAEVPTLYREEILSSVQAFLFGDDDSASCSYFRVPHQTANFWFKNGCEIGRLNTKSNDIEKPSTFQVRLADPGIELFISPHGLGVFSVTFAPKEVSDLRYMQEFNYRLSQTRPYTAYRFRLPHNDHNPNPVPENKVALTQRLGAAGGEFDLLEWVEFLLAPLQALGFKRGQDQLSVYTVTRFDDCVFTDPNVQLGVGSRLASMAHVEEYHHPGSLEVCEQQFNPHHWAAVGCLGAAHFVADQGAEAQGFDEQRLPRAIYKYFVPYLLALMQRLTLLRILDDARVAIPRKASDGQNSVTSDNLVANIRALNTCALKFTINGYFTEVSNREVHNQYYALAQAGLRVKNSFETVQRTLHNAEMIDNDRFQSSTVQELHKLIQEANANANVVAHVQAKVEWLEVFFVSYYATALVYYITHDGSIFVHEYTIASLILAPFISGLVAFFGLSPHKLRQHHHGKGNSALGFLLLLVLIFAGWLGIGFNWFPAKIAHHGTNIIDQAGTPPLLEGKVGHLTPSNQEATNSSLKANQP